jgi:cytochrome c556
MKQLLAAAAATVLLAGCGQGSEGTNAANDTLAQANATGNQASAVVENAVQQSNATPLQKEQALALMEERHEGYEKIGDAMKVASRELKGDSPDLAAVRTSAGQIADLAPKVSGWFPVGTGPDVGKTDALAEIWAKPEDFAVKAKAFTNASAVFQTAAAGGDLTAMRAAHGNLGKSCKSCHDLYRAKDD